MRTSIAPRVDDFELRHFVDLMLRVNAGDYLIEAAVACVGWAKSPAVRIRSHNATGDLAHA